jgi:hypothetical protein
MRAPPKRNAAVAGRDVSGDRHSGSIRSPLDSQSLSQRQTALFTARPRGTRWAVAAISPKGAAVKLGDFPRRAFALNAAAIMAGACGGRWCP